MLAFEFSPRHYQFEKVHAASHVARNDLSIIDKRTAKRSSITGKCRELVPAPYLPYLQRVIIGSRDSDLSVHAQRHSMDRSCVADKGAQLASAPHFPHLDRVVIRS